MSVVGLQKGEGLRVEGSQEPFWASGTVGRTFGSNNCQMYCIERLGDNFQKILQIHLACG